MIRLRYCFIKKAQLIVGLYSGDVINFECQLQFAYMRKLKNEELERLSVQKFQQHKKFPFVILLDNIRSLNNVGSAFRTGDAFLVEKIILAGITGQPPHREIQKTALGATESVLWEYEKDVSIAVDRLKQEGYVILAVEQAEGSKCLYDYKYKKNSKVCFVFGNEVFGVSEEVMNICDDCIEIPQFGTKHSLNISVSTGIVIWDFYTKTLA